MICQAGRFAVRYAALVALAGVLLWAQSQDLAEKSRRGQELMASERYEEAAAVYRELIDALPGNPGLLLNLGMALHMAGKDREAIPYLEQTLKLQPGTPAGLAVLGLSHLRLGEAAEAVKPLEQAVKLLPSDPTVRGALGDALLTLEQHQVAARHFEVLAQMEKSAPHAWFGLGRCYEGLAVAAFNKLVAKAPESAFVLALLGEARLKEKRYPAAFHFYRQAAERDTGLRGIQAALAEIYRATGHPDWATVAQRKESRLPAPDCRSRPLECHFRAGRYREVEAATRSAVTPAALYWRTRACNELASAAFARLSQLPDSRELHETLALLNRAQGRHVESAKEWREALKFAPGDPRLESELAASLRLSGDLDSARPLLEKLVKTEPGSAGLNYLLGDVLLAQERPTDAIPFLEAALRLSPAMREAHSSLGLAYLQAGQVEKAVPHLKTALPLDQDGSLHFQLARAHQAAGNEEEARQALAKSQQLREAAQADSQQARQQFTILPP